MRELESEIERWRRGAERRTGLDVDQLDELEEHLRAAVRDELARGLASSAAFERASRRLGDVALLQAYFPKPPLAMNHASKLLGVVLSAAIVLFTLDQTGQIASFLAPGKLAVVVGLIAAGLLAGHGIAPMGAAARCALTGRKPAAGPARHELAALARRGYRLSWAAGALASLMSALVALTAMGSPESLWTELARSSFGVLYGALLAEIVFANLWAWVAPTPEASAG